MAVEVVLNTGTGASVPFCVCRAPDDHMSCRRHRPTPLDSMCSSMCDGTWQVCSLVKLFSSSSHSQPIPSPISSPSTTLSLALAMAMLSLRSISDLPGAAARGTIGRFLAWQRSCQENCRAESAEHFGRLHLALPPRLLHFLCAFEEGAHLSISHRIAPHTRRERGKTGWT